MKKQDLIIYKTEDGKSDVALYVRDGTIWLNQNQLAELFATSKQNVSSHVINILKENELNESSAQVISRWKNRYAQNMNNSMPVAKNMTLNRPMPKT